MPVGTPSIKLSIANSEPQVEGSAEDDGVEPQWLTRPLDRLIDGVQYPLATSSKRCLPLGSIAADIELHKSTKVAIPKTGILRRQFPPDQVSQNRRDQGHPVQIPTQAKPGLGWATRRLFTLQSLHAARSGEL